MKTFFQNHKPLLFLLGMTLSFVSYGQEDEADMLDMSLEDLMNMEVTSVSKKAERLQDVASSIYVVSSEDILNSGATNIIEVLRNVPGFWAVQDHYSSANATMRNSTPANVDPGTVLYLLDGTPIQDLMGATFSFLNFDIPLDEIDRIEVIRGSGGTIYGANSATGVVNIFTKNPESYDGMNVRAEGAAPGYAAASIRAGGSLSNKLAISGYAKYRYFSGWESLAGKDEDGNDVTLVKGETEFTEDYEKMAHYSAGLKLNFNINEKSTLSFKSHFNGMNKTTYSNWYGVDFALTQDDHVVENNVKANRLVANLRFDHQFSDTHSLFARVSTNMENDFYRVGGGMQVSNAIYDIEIQDNISLGAFNDLSIGANYRFVKFDIHDINETTYINYIDPQNNESLKGAFVQDKIKLLDKKLNFIVGIKAENYSLVNDDYYFSPMAKASFIANKNITFWGGFTQSYTTPGFNSTNIDWFLFQSPNEVVASQMVIAGAIAQGYTAEEAAFYVATPDGQNDVQSIVQGVSDIAVKNGTNTEPTRFQTFEIGLKSSFAEKVQLNSTFFMTYIEDGIAVNPGNALISNIESPTQEGRFADYYLYGNYVKGESMGTETTLRYFPIHGLNLEISHSWLSQDWEYQENPDFDLDPSHGSPNSVPNFVPEHIFRFKANYAMENGFSFNLQLIQTTEFRTQARYVYETERYENLVEPDLIGAGLFPRNSTIIAKNDSRTILNLRIEKTLLDNQLSIYAFGNDITNSGEISDTSDLRNVTLHQIGGMYGLGLNYKLF